MEKIKMGHYVEKSEEISPEVEKEEKRFSLSDLEEAKDKGRPWVESAEEAQRSLIEQIKEAEGNLKQLLEGVKEGTNLHERLKELAYHYSETRSKKDERGTPEGDFEAAIRDFENWYKAKLELLLNEKWRRLEILSSEEKGGKDKELNEKAYLIAKEKGFSVDPIKCNDDAREELLKGLSEKITDEEVREFMAKEEEIKRRVEERMAEKEKVTEERVVKEERLPEEQKPGTEEQLEKDIAIAKLEKEFDFLLEEYRRAKSNIKNFKGIEREIEEKNLKLIKDKYSAKKEELIREKIKRFIEKHPEIDINKNPEKIIEEVLNQMKGIEDKEREILLPPQEKKRWEKFRDWWRRHPIARMVIGAGLTIATIGSIYTGQLYLTPALIGARMGLAGVSTAIATEALLERWNNYLKKGTTGRLLKLTKKGDFDKIKEITKGLTLEEITNQIGKISVIQQKEGLSIGPYAGIINTLKQRERELLINTIKEESVKTDTDLADAFIKHLIKQQEITEQAIKLSLDTQRKNEIKNRILAITSGMAMAGLVGHFGFTRLAEAAITEPGETPGQEPEAGAEPEPERGLKNNFSLELGKGEISPHLERVFQAIAIDHMKDFGPDRVFGVEEGAKSLNIAANLEELVKGNNVAGIKAEEVKGIFVWDPKNNVLEIKNYSEFNKLLDRLEVHADGLWEKGILQGPGGAAGHLDKIKTWEDTIKAKGLEEIGIRGHEIDPGKIVDFGKDPTVQAAKLPIEEEPVTKVKAEVPEEVEAKGEREEEKPVVEAKGEREEEKPVVEAKGEREEEKPVVEAKGEREEEKPVVEAKGVEVPPETPIEEWFNKALREPGGALRILPEVLRQIETDKLTARGFLDYYEKVMNTKYTEESFNNLKQNFDMIKNEGKYTKQNVELAKGAIKVLLLEIENKIKRS